MMCGAEEMLCPGGMTSQGCPMPDMCWPSKGKFEIHETHNNIINKYGIISFKMIGMDSNGVECSGVCPTICAPGDMICPGGMTETGCIIADTCQAEGTECPLPPMPM